ncbi:MAG: hypothetical protein QTN59_00125 [Candidatus Electrothrix communis]|nr:MAG: hypothetical protein QTN59_00125 [Candidatus Electrothrix communis]
MISIGNRQVIFLETLLCPIGEYIDLKVKIPSEKDLWRIRVRFSEVSVTIGEKNKVKEKIGPYMDAKEEDGLWVINFVNWSNRSGHSFDKPVEVGRDNNGNRISLLVSIAKLSTLYRIHMQIMVAEDKDV